MSAKRLWPSIIITLAILALLVAIALLYQKNHRQLDHPGQKPQHHRKILWGVDTASKVTDSLYQCITDHYGKPLIWGRYMESKENISKGLTKKEASFIHKKGGHILLIYNHFTDATGYNNGVSEGKMAISFANDLGVPKGTALFADIEPTYPVDADFIRGWVKTLSPSSYMAGIYGDFSKNSGLRKAYHSAANKLNSQPILWSDQPRPGITGKQKAPDFHPAAPKSSKNLVWQYGIGAKKCNIDTDLARSNIQSYLW
ncbi:MAG TPA: glycoside hydrolase domain-containing protein [Bacillales bacterium]|nr:glycoside hydrolase domain-containing protein [Bacillales bacterium]